MLAKVRLRDSIYEAEQFIDVLEIGQLVPISHETEVQRAPPVLRRVPVTAELDVVLLANHKVAAFLDFEEGQVEVLDNLGSPLLFRGLCEFGHSPLIVLLSRILPTFLLPWPRLLTGLDLCSRNVPTPQHWRQLTLVLIHALLTAALSTLGFCRRVGPWPVWRYRPVDLQVGAIDADEYFVALLRLASRFLLFCLLIGYLHIRALVLALTTLLASRPTVATGPVARAGCRTDGVVA